MTMEDHEIKTKRLSDWKPETDIKLQKAFGKFVEESGELLVAAGLYTFSTNQGFTHELESEVADCLAFIDIIATASEGRLDGTIPDIQPFEVAAIIKQFDSSSFNTELILKVGKALNIVGRCQIQGLNGNDPETSIPNRLILGFALHELQVVLNGIIVRCKLDPMRITSRKQAKIDSKLPWVMGTATDLLPDVQECRHDR
jgi:hypothetical protein